MRQPILFKFSQCAQTFSRIRKHCMVGEDVLDLDYIFTLSVSVFFPVYWNIFLESTISRSIVLPHNWYFRAKGDHWRGLAMLACLLLLQHPLLLLLLATLGVGGPSFHSFFEDHVHASPAGNYIEPSLGVGDPLKSLGVSSIGFPLGLSGSPVKGIFRDSGIRPSPFLARRTRSSPPHIDPYYRYITFI